ncbi:MAG: FISUMP domain-containing protein [Bacteroidota bacterium]|nr:FISUMP domain-containing protein [Bacteroidota bacterium]
MKRIILALTLVLVLNWTYAQTGSITNIQVSQGTGENERLVEIVFDLTGNETMYDISLQVSFDNGVSYTPIDPDEVTGSIQVAPGTGIQLFWDGRISHAGQSAEMTRIKIVATGFFLCGTTITDDDNNIYNTVLIGNQCWMAENMKYETETGSLCYGENPSNCATYGRLYDWATMMNGSSSSNSVPSGVQGICPDGWHIPGNAEWDILVTHLGGSSLAGGKMKETGTTHWLSPNTGATNESGFTALPGGYHHAGGDTFFYLYKHGFWWSATGNSSSEAYRWGLSYNEADVNQDYDLKVQSFSVRCLKD